MKRPKIGDVIEIRTKVGFAYALYTQKLAGFGAFIRLFDTVYQKRPESFKEVVLDKVRFCTFFPLGAAVSRGIVEIVAREEVPSELQEFPVLRIPGIIDPLTKRARSWVFWDGEKYWNVDELTNEQRKLSFKGVVNDTMLIHWIESGWTPETDRFN